MNKNVIKFRKDPYIISEIGINHNGYLSLAKKLIKLQFYQVLMQ